MLLTRKSDTAPAAAPRLKRLSGASAADDRPPHVPQGLRHRRRRRRVRHAAALGAIQPAKRAEAGEGRQDRGPPHGLHALLGRLRDRRASSQNGVWVRQEPVFDSPINLGAHCAKGASVREHGMTEHSHRLKYADEAGRRQVPDASPGSRRSTRSATSCSRSARSRARRDVLGRLAPSTTTSRPTCSASSCPCSAPTTWTTRRASATRPRSRAWRTPGATAR